MDDWYNMENCPAYTMVTGKEKKNPGLQNRIHACKSSGPLFKNLAIKAAIKIQIINLMAKI